MPGRFVTVSACQRSAPRRNPGPLPLRWFTAAAAASLDCRVFAALNPAPLGRVHLALGPGRRAVRWLVTGSAAGTDRARLRAGPRGTRSTTLQWVRMRSPAASREAPSKVTCSSAPRQRSTRPSRGRPTGTGCRGTCRSAASPLVLGYNPSSKFAQALRTKPWYDVIDQPGFLIGRTDPTTDPKGVLAVTGSRPGGQGARPPRPEGHRVVDVERVPRDLARRAASSRAARRRVLLRGRGGRGRHQDDAPRRVRTSPATTPSPFSTGPRTRRPPAPS